MTTVKKYFDVCKGVCDSPYDEDEELPPCRMRYDSEPCHVCKAKQGEHHGDICSVGG